MKPIFSILLLLLSFSLRAELLKVNVSCEGANLHYINQFETQGSFIIDSEVWQSLNDEEVVLDGISLDINLRKAGYESEWEDLTAADLKGTLKKVDNRSITQKPFYVLRLFSKVGVEPKIIMNLVVDYPGLQNSTLRVDNFYEYKAACSFE